MPQQDCLSAGRQLKKPSDSLHGESFKGLVLIRDVKLEGGRQRHPSGGVSAKEMVIGLEGVELGADGKVRSQQKTASEIIIRKNTQTKNIVNCLIFLIGL